MLAILISLLVCIAFNSNAQILEGELKYDTLLSRSLFIDDVTILSSTLSIDDDDSRTTSLVLSHFENGDWLNHSSPKGIGVFTDAKSLYSLEASSTGDYLSFLKVSSINRDSIMLTIYRQDNQEGKYSPIFLNSEFGPVAKFNPDIVNYSISENGKRLVTIFPTDNVWQSTYVQEVNIYDLNADETGYSHTYTYLSKHDIGVPAVTSLDISSNGNLISIGYNLSADYPGDYDSEANILEYNVATSAWVEASFYLEHADEDSNTGIPRYTEIASAGNRIVYAHHGDASFTQSGEAGIKIFDNTTGDWLPHKDSIRAQGQGYDIPSREHICLSDDGTLLGVIFQSPSADTTGYFELFRLTEDSLMTLANIAYPVANSNSYVMGSSCDISPSGRRLLLHDRDSTFLVYNLDNLLDTNDEPFRDASLKIFPNPTVDQLFIEFSDGNVLEWLEVYTAQGEVVMGKITPKDKISMAYLSAGIYFIRIGIGDEVVSRKIVKI